MILVAVAAGLVAGVSHVALINLVMLAGAASALALTAPLNRHAPCSPGRGTRA